MGVAHYEGYVAFGIKIPKYLSRLNIVNIAEAVVNMVLTFVLIHFTYVHNELMADLAEELTGERPDFNN
jgi:hypothetical protein